MLKVAFRTDVTATIGTGHLSRCLALAEALHSHGTSCTFVFAADAECMVPPTTGHAERRLSTGAGTAWERDAEATLAVLDPATDWVVLDHYGLAASWESVLRRSGHRLLVIDDLDDRPHDCDLLLDQAFGRLADHYAGRVPADCSLLLGPSFALLRPAFARAHGTGGFPSAPYRIHLFLGSGAPIGSLPRLACLLLENFASVTVAAVGRAIEDEMTDLGRRFAGRITWQLSVDDMAAHMASCNVAMGSPGVATWERACVGLPAAIMATHANQIAILGRLDHAGFARYLGEAWALSDESFVRGAGAFLENTDALLRYRTVGLNAVDGAGAVRVARAMETWRPG